MDQNKSRKLLREFVSQAMREYFDKIDGYPIDKVYNLVIGEVEKPLIEETIKYCNGNQSRASELLGLSRGTLRKKMKQYNIS
ncbi:MAG: DNA-binding transcriptional regulator Fis [Gammaproteobacteria bacterium]|nr:DNA-binding transcriptional regulator Fis [Gammaproteobacteria bacterium]